MKSVVFKIMINNILLFEFYKLYPQFIIALFFY